MSWSGALGEAHAVLEAQRQAWCAGDLAAFMRGYEPSDDITFVSPSGVRRGYAQLAADYAARYADKAAMGTLSFRDLELREVADTVVLAIGRFVLLPAGEGATEASGMFSLVLRRGNAGWKVVHDHTS
jgi:ketosteroid isomerase-like protein